MHCCLWFRSVFRVRGPWPKYYGYHLSIIINPRRACAERVTVVVSCVCVCLYVCLSAHAILAVRAIRSITKDAIVLSVRFSAILRWRFP